MATLPKPVPSSRRSAHTATAKRPLPVERTLAASKAKTHLLELLKDVDRKREPIVITRRGKPIAKLVPIAASPVRNVFGCMKGTFKIVGDIVGPEPDIWEAMQ